MGITVRIDISPPPSPTVVLFTQQVASGAGADVLLLPAWEGWY